MLDSVLPIRSTANCLVGIKTWRKKFDCVGGKHSIYPQAKIYLCVCVPLQSHMIPLHLSMIRSLTLLDPSCNRVYYCDHSVYVCSEVSLPLQHLSTPNPPLMNVIPHPKWAPSHRGTSSPVGASPSSSKYQGHVSPTAAGETCLWINAPLGHGPQTSDARLSSGVSSSI